MFYVITYDIIDDKKRAKVADTLLDFGKRVQYSVFECELTDVYLENLVRKLKKIISPEDSIRIYSLCSQCSKSIRILGVGNITKDEFVVIL
jgi:CRISPR-associated protein Cas2